MKYTISVLLRKIVVLGRFYREKFILDPQNVGENDPQNVGKLNPRFLIKNHPGRYNKCPLAIIFMFNWPKKFNKTLLQKMLILGKFGKLPIGQILSDLDTFIC